MNQIRLSAEAKLWEVVATMIAAQAAGWLAAADPGGLLQAMELTKLAMPDGGTDQIWATAEGYNKVYRDLEDSKADEPYPVALGRALNLPKPDPQRLVLNLPHEPGIPLYRNAIILAPFGLRRDLEIPLVVWRHIARFCRSYGLPVLLLGDYSARMDIATFTEGDLLGRQDMATILATLEAAEVVVGVPNEWTWLAACYRTKIALMYPETMPSRRWFWFGGNRIARGVFVPSNIQTPIVLTTIRKIFEVI